MDDRVGIAITVAFAVLSVAIIGGFAVGIIHDDGYTYSKISASADDGIASVGGVGYSRDGDSVTLTADLKPGHFLQGWYDSDGNLVSTNNPYTFVSKEDVVLTARTEAGFSVTTYTGNGVNSVYGLFPQRVNFDIKAVVADGHSLAGWYNIKTGEFFKDGNGNVITSTVIRDINMSNQGYIAAISDSTLFQGDSELKYSYTEAYLTTLKMVVVDTASGDFVASSYGTGEIDITVAPGNYTIIIEGSTTNSQSICERVNVTVE